MRDVTSEGMPALQALLPSKKLELRKLVKGLDEASKDNRLNGVIAYIGDINGRCGLAVAQEARNAVLDFRWALPRSCPGRLCFEA